jgi:hypothetical protein
MRARTYSGPHTSHASRNPTQAHSNNDAGWSEDEGQPRIRMLNREGDYNRIEEKGEDDWLPCVAIAKGGTRARG